MKAKILAIAVAATASGHALAAEIYNSDGQTLAIGGYVDVGIGEYGSSTETEVHQVSPRLNIAGSQDIGHGLTVDAKGEWALNYLGGGESSFTTRLGYIGVKHDTGGSLVVGTQWSPYYDVGGVADMPIAFANDFLYYDHNNLATGRGEKMVTYRNGVMVGDMASINLGLGWQGKHTDTSLTTSSGNGTVITTRSSTEYDTRAVASLSVDVAGFGLGYAYSGGDVAMVDATSHIVSLHYGRYGDGIYAAAVYGMNDDFYAQGSGAILAESEQYEAVLAFGMANGLNLSVNYEAVEDDRASQTQYSQSALQAEYSVTPKLVGFAGYQFDLGNDLNVKEEDKWSIGARYFL